MRVKGRAWEPNGTGQGRVQKVLVLCQWGKPPPFQISEWGLHRGPGGCTIRSDNSEPPTAGMEPSWQEPSLWSRLQCDVVLLPEFSMSPPGKKLSGAGGLLNYRCLSVRMTQGLTTLKISYIKKKWQKYRWGRGWEAEGLTTSQAFSRNISTPSQQSPQEENIMEKQAMRISLHCWTQRPKSQSTNIVFRIQTPRGRNTDLALGSLSQT